MPPSSDIFRQVASAVDIVDVVGEHIALKRAGREFKCLCPFHDDHKPSMAVVPHKQIFHCFVCGTGGDVFKFVELYHKMSKGEALRMLAQRAGITLPDLPGRGGQGPQRDKDGLTARERIASTNEWACSFFEKHLRTPEGKVGLEYLHSRGLTDETIARFRLGMSPDSWTGLATTALRLGVSTQNLSEAGLVKQRQDGSPYDAFRNRVIFPIIDASGGGGRVIAFGGRVLVEKRDEAGNVVEAKYLNSPDSPLFNKSESLYGLNHARQQIIRTRTVVVVEGYMDVIACHQVGVTNVVATLGTALTPDHARILKNYAQTVVLIFDSDDAGRRAADRAMDIFVNKIDVKITAVPEGKDPCDYCMKMGGEAFQKVVDGALDALTFQWNRLQGLVHGTDSVAARQDAITQFMRYAAAAMSPRGGIHEIDPIRRGQLIVKMSKIIGLPVNEVTALLYSASYKETPRRPQDAKSVDPYAELRRKAGVSPGGNAGYDAQRWDLGLLLQEPMIYKLVRDFVDVPLFYSFPLLAQLVIEYLEYGHGELEQCSLADFTRYVESLGEQNDEMALAKYCAMLWERMAGDWLDPVHLSTETAKLMRYWQDQLGHTPEKVVRDCLNYLRELRRQKTGYEDSQEGGSPAPPPSSDGAEEQELREFIEEERRRDRQGMNVRRVGMAATTEWASDLHAARQRVEKLEEVAKKAGVETALA